MLSVDTRLIVSSRILCIDCVKTGSVVVWMKADDYIPLIAETYGKVIEVG